MQFDAPSSCDRHITIRRDRILRGRPTLSDEDWRAGRISRAIARADAVGYCAIRSRGRRYARLKEPKKHGAIYWRPLAIQPCHADVVVSLSSASRDEGCRKRVRRAE